MVSRVVLLDTGPLGLVTNPKRSPTSMACAQWLQALVTANRRVIIPKLPTTNYAANCCGQTSSRVAARCSDTAPRVPPDYNRGDAQAAEILVQARQLGQPTAGDNTLDGDMILAAQATTLGVSNVVIATTNVGHLSRFAPAELWQSIRTA